ncbi:hypothetical protein IMSAGC007_03599 [Lachnospiraceae bacterium]|nr:hypothetical protein IMSAGC007_03599 [Lachnospiraceae bacterium]
MMQCFNWDTNTLNIKTNTNKTFNFILKGNKTVVCGYSATGKSLLCNIIRRYQNSSNVQTLKKYNLDNIFILDRSNKEKLAEQNHKLIIIDRADLILEKADIDIINSDTDINKYLIFSRKPLGIYLSPNYFANLEVEDNTVRLRYLFNVRGWN